MESMRAIPPDSASTVALIAAVGLNRAIGKNGQLLWRLPEDMWHFRDTTRGKPVVMGRKTWESLPEAFRPLPGRLNIVVTHKREYPARGALVAASLEDALRIAGDAPEIFVIGGAELYRQTMPIAQRLCLTEVADCPDADAFFPEVSADSWQEVSREAVRAAGTRPDFTFVEYRRRKS
ncbi:MAG: dihydrofolate reductase [Candidatus Accumulibacter sp.]|jgi:dihydrofolate reductase|nr:dihydrofolate reductase [Accumulibacter sp.]